MLKYKSKELRDHFFIDLLIKDQYKILRHIVFLLLDFGIGIKNLTDTRLYRWFMHHSLQ